MDAIQKWFEQLAGISRDELDRIALAEEVFADRTCIDTSGLKVPACWRRDCKVQAIRHRPGRSFSG